MKKILAIILSLLLIAAPVYSYAVLPFVAAAAATMTRVLVGNAIKKPAATAMATAGMGILGIYKFTSAGFFIRCISADDNKIYMTTNEFYNYMQRNLSGV